MELDVWQLQKIIRETAKETVKEMLAMQNPSKDEITERQAFREFGEGWVKHQRAIGVLEAPKRKGVYPRSPKIYSRKRLSELKFGVSPLIKNIF